MTTTTATLPATTKEISVSEVIQAAHIFKELLAAKRIEDFARANQLAIRIEQIGKPYGYRVPMMLELVVIFHTQLLKGMEAKVAA